MSSRVRRVARDAPLRRLTDTMARGIPITVAIGAINSSPQRIPVQDKSMLAAVAATIKLVRESAPMM